MIELSEARSVSLVTGAASGIGAAIVKRLRDRGDRVLAVDLAEPPADGGDLLGVVADVGDREQVEAAIETAVEAFGRLDYLFNNAGVMDDFSPVGDLDDEAWRRSFRVNVDGPMYAIRAALPTMLEQGRGAIVNTASAAALRGGRAGAAYTSSKHAVLGLTRSVAYFHGEQGIRCNALCPGATRPTGIMAGTEFHRGALERAKGLLDTVPPAATPEQQAEVAAFLNSEAAAYVNGVALLADGGWLAA